MYYYIICIYYTYIHTCMNGKKSIYAHTYIHTAGIHKYILDMVVNVAIKVKDVVARCQNMVAQYLQKNRQYS